jgi:PemK-like, MazF-like toxin of type II toxin-antitoxin system
MIVIVKSLIIFMQYLILLVKIPFIEKEGYKVRPVIQLTDLLDDLGNFQVVYISSKVTTNLQKSEILIDSNLKEFEDTGLMLNSVIKTSKIFTVTESSVKGQLGLLSEELSIELKEQLKINFKII